MSKPLLCVTVTADTMADLRRKRDEVADADLIELRLDTVRDPSAAGALAGRRTGVILTCRPTWEGGQFQGPEEERKRILAEGQRLGAEYIDVEWRAGFTDLITESHGRGIVLSMHDFDGVPADLGKRLREMLGAGAEVTKLAVKATRLADCATLLDLAVKRAGQQRIVWIAMGDYGLPTRILPQRFGSAWTYAGTIAEVGQLTAATLVKDYHFRAIGDATAIYGVVAGSVSHSVSPVMHNAAFRAQHVDAVYVPLPAASADDFLTFGRAVGLKGASVTIPHKVSLFERLDEVDPVARRIGAVNTIRVDGRRWLGANTDAGGFLEPLQERMPLKGKRASILGAGGAARAVAVALASSGSAITVHARSREQAQQVAMLVGGDVGQWPPAAGEWDLLVNCTPIGQTPQVDATPMPAGALTGRLVYDLVYNPTTTRLLREASAAGCQTLGGLEMLVAQAHAQFQWWTGLRPPSGVMREAALKRLAEFVRDENHVV